MTTARFSRLTLVCALSCVALFIGGVAIGGGEHGELYWAVGVQGAKLAALVGAVLAATAFERGDYLRRAWLLVAANYTLITFNVFFFGGMGHSPLLARIHLPGLGADSALADRLDDTCVIIANLLAIVGTVLLARAWKVAGLEPAQSPLKRGLITGAALVVAATLAGIPLVSFIRLAVEHSTLHVWTGIVSSGADGICFALIAPLALTAFALRGGVLWWPWALYSGASFGWIVFDALLVVRGVVVGHVAPSPLLVSTVQSIRIFACLFSFAAALAQRWALRATHERR